MPNGTDDDIRVGPPLQIMQSAVLMVGIWIDEGRVPAAQREPLITDLVWLLRSYTSHGLTRERPHADDA